MAWLHTIRETQSALAVIVSPEIRPTPRAESLERFLTRPVRRWCQEQGQAGKGPKVKLPRHWRTRKDPFEGVWCEVLERLQEDPDTGAMAPPGRLQANHPNRLSRAKPRTLQRRVRQWRGIMSNNLVTPASESPPPELIGLRDMALAMGDPRR